MTALQRSGIEANSCCMDSCVDGCVGCNACDGYVKPVGKKGVRFGHLIGQNTSGVVPHWYFTGGLLFAHNHSNL